jgi:hypothetical protein
MAATGTEGQRSYAAKKLSEAGMGPGGDGQEPQKAQLDVNVAPQQVQINIPEIQNVVADVMQTTALKVVADAFQNYVSNLKGTDGSPEANANAASQATPDAFVQGGIDAGAVTSQQVGY